MTPPVIVAGGGWAGLAAAVELTARGVPVQLLESAPQLGGRARSLAFGAETVDNGQHLLVGAYRDTLALMRRVGVDPQHAFLRLPLSWDMLGGRTRLRLRAPPLPVPLHAALALLGARGVPLRERLGALAMSARLTLDGYRCDASASVADLLAAHRQGPALRHLLWEPLCLGALNTPAAEASASVFLRVLRDTFGGARRDADLLIPSQPLGALLPEPAARYIETAGGRVRTGSRVVGLRLEDGRVTGVRTPQGMLPARAVVLALPAPATARLLAPLPALAATARAAAALEHRPIATVYLRYGSAVQCGPLRGFADGVGQWVFAHGHCGSPQRAAVVISGSGPHEAWSRAELTAAVAGELTRKLGLPEPVESLVVRERRATFACTPATEALRPAARAPVRGLWLAGDWTATGYPATLEGAVRSGLECARLITDPASRDDADPRQFP